MSILENTRLTTVNVYATVYDMANVGIVFEDGIEEDDDRCANCAKALPYGEEVRIGSWLYCGPCAHEEREAAREEDTKC